MQNNWCHENPAPNLTSLPYNLRKCSAGQQSSSGLEINRETGFPTGHCRSCSLYALAEIDNSQELKGGVCYMPV